MADPTGIQVTFLDQTGAKSVKAKIALTVTVAKMIPSIITKMSLPVTAPDGTPMSYSLDHKEGGKRLQETQTLPDAGVKEGDHLIVYPEIVAGAALLYTMKLRSAGNPDFGQYAPVSEPEVVTGSTLMEMRDAAQAYIDKWDLGGGNWISPIVKQGKKVVGHFSYNMRFWEGGPAQWTSATREIQIEFVVKGGAL